MLALADHLGNRRYFNAYENVREGTHSRVGIRSREQSRIDIMDERG
jgi:hypothetical protein